MCHAPICGCPFCVRDLSGYRSPAPATVRSLTDLRREPVKPAAQSGTVANTIEYSHSSFLRTLQEIFGVEPSRGFPWLGGALNATDLSDLFEPGTIR
jgi:hypothetical protein